MPDIEINILDEFDIDLTSNELITLVGAGGKTTTMFDIARYLKSVGKSVLVTTTTAIYYPDADQYDDICVTERISFDLFKFSSTPSINVLGSKVNNEGKLLGISKEDINDIFNRKIFEYIIVEGDGSKKRPIKAPAKHEPVIPELSTKVIGVIGFDTMGKEINSDNVHRPELFCDISHCNIGDIIDEEKLLLLIKNENGLFKGTPKYATRYLKLNKVKDQDLNSALEIKNRVGELKLDIRKVVITPFF